MRPDINKKFICFIKYIHLYDLLVYIIDEKNNKVESVFMPEILSEDNPEVIETPVKTNKDGIEVN